MTLGANQAIFLAAAGTPSTPPAFRASATANTGVGTSASTVSLTIPSSVLSGDLLLVFVTKQDQTPNTNSFTINGSARTFTLARTDTATGSANNVRVYTHWAIAQAGDASKTLAVTFSIGNDIAEMTLVVYSGCNQSTPIDVSGANVTTASNPSVTTQAITTTRANTTIVSHFGFFLIATTNLTLSTPASTTSRAEDHTEDYVSIRTVDETQVAAGATTQRTSTTTNNGSWVAVNVALRS